jgi:hypothetical protein
LIDLVGTLEIAAVTDMSSAGQASATIAPNTEAQQRHEDLPFQETATDESRVGGRTAGAFGSITLSDVRLTDAALPQSIWGLGSTLTELHLSRNSLETLPAALGKLVSLFADSKFADWSAHTLIWTIASDITSLTFHALGISGDNVSMLLGRVFFER